MYIIYIFYTKKKHYEYDFEVSSLMGFPWLYYSNFFFQKIYYMFDIENKNCSIYFKNIWQKNIIFTKWIFFKKIVKYFF